MGGWIQPHGETLSVARKTICGKSPGGPGGGGQVAPGSCQCTFRVSTTAEKEGTVAGNATRDGRLALVFSVAWPTYGTKRAKRAGRLVLHMLCGVWRAQWLTRKPRIRSPTRSWRWAMQSMNPTTYDLLDICANGRADGVFAVAEGLWVTSSLPRPMGSNSEKTLRKGREGAFGERTSS